MLPFIADIGCDACILVEAIVLNLAAVIHQVFLFLIDKF